MTIRTQLNNIISIVGVGLVWFTDFVNWVYDPFQDFDRPLQEKYPEPLWQKAIKFEIDMADFFMPDRGIIRYTLPTNSGDQAIWHGVYTAMLAVKYSVVRDENTLQLIWKCLDGLHSHQHPTGELNPRLIRGWRDDGTYEDEASNDQMTGHLLGIYFAWKYGDISCRTHARALIEGLADEIAIHGNKLVNADGSVTKHGNLENGYLTDPLNLTLCLATYKVAFKITGEPLYMKRYDELVKKYRLRIPYGKVKLLWWEKTYDTHRAAIHYSILCDLEADHDLHRLYLRGLLRVWKIAKKSANPWVYYLVRRVCLVDPAMEEQVRKHLKEFTLEDKQHNAERINSTKVETFKWGGNRRVRQPLPRWLVGSQDFFWQRHLYSADDWVGNGAGNLRHNGGDFLTAYWGLRSLRIIGVDE